MIQVTKLVRSTLLFIFLAAIFASTVIAQEAVVKRNVFLRPEPSTSNKPIRKLIPPDEIELISEAPVSGFYNVRTVEGDDEGWVWGQHIRIAFTDAAAIDLEDSISTLALDTSAALASTFPKNLPKPPPVTGTTTSGSKTCGPTGSSPGNETNRLKNRVDIPSKYKKVTFQVFDRLPDLSPPKDRKKWTEEDTTEIAKYEGSAISMVGYLVAIKPQVGGSGESTNCNWTKAAETDWHMALVQKAGQGEELAIVVETTPRIRKKHPKWTKANLEPWLETSFAVRISGWLMFDPEHRNHMGKYRKSMWEIHPITKIEVWDQGKWVDLDKL